MKRATFLAAVALLAPALSLAAATIACVGEDAVPAGGSSGDGPAQGAEGAACFGNQTCMTAELSCLSNVCVRAGDGGPGGTPPGTPPPPPPPPPGTPSCGEVPETGQIPCANGNLTCDPGAGESCCWVGTSLISSCESIANDCNAESGPILSCADSDDCGGLACCAVATPRQGDPCGLDVSRTVCAPSCGAGQLEICSDQHGCVGGGNCQAARGYGVGQYAQSIAIQVGVCR